ncbi:GNAT family N-acetyltransferase [Paenibacillus thermoaerophilus]|uniref:GNAT family N-acetyltransferase n=1 Tax=Paenibacillus thermoaerophilus TaxID=1215385 RepID=A0ABW2V086_9BACL|nr:GNAT family N-acetyltransferase [Paenibacillus thermoaerophilus]TMV18302.1 N-acetyltransferase family protein [Paenibacillus thermoaerophilus]
MLIRDAVPADLPALLDIYNDAIRKLTATFDLEEQTLEQRTEWFRHYGGRYPLIVADIGGTVAGYACLSKFRDKPAYDRTVELSVYIGEAYRGRGVGNALVKEILARAAEHRHHVVVSGITAGNEASIRMHEKFGFELCGRFREVGFKFGEWQDVLFYQLVLPE